MSKKEREWISKQRTREQHVIWRKLINLLRAIYLFKLAKNKARDNLYSNKLEV